MVMGIDFHFKVCSSIPFINLEMIYSKRHPLKMPKLCYAPTEHSTGLAYPGDAFSAVTITVFIMIAEIGVCSL